MNEEIMSGAGTLATLVGLICNWKQERGAQNQKRFESFIVWLENHNFCALKERILESDELQRDLQHLLRGDLAEINEKLGLVCDAITAVSERIEGLSSLARSMKSSSDLLSDQACEILKWFLMDGAERFVSCYHPHREPSPYQIFSTRTRRCIYPMQTQFLEGDLDALLSLGYIKMVAYTSRDNDPMYSLTRQGARFAATLSETLAPEDAPDE